MRKLSSSFFLANSASFTTTDIKVELAAVVQKETFVAVDLKDLDETVKVIKRKEKGPLAATTIIDLEMGLIVPVFHEEDLAKVPSYVPYWPFVGKDGKVKVFVNLNRYAKRAAGSTELTIGSKTFHGLCVGADIVRRIAENSSRYTGSSELVVNTGIIYTRMIRKVIDKNYAISVDPVLDDKIRYLLGKYFAKSVCGITSESLIETVAGSCVEKTGLGIITTVNEIFTEEDYVDFESFIRKLAETYPRIAKLSIRQIVQDISRLYGITSIIGVDYFPYLVASITQSTLAFNLNNEFSFEAISGKEASKVVMTMARLAAS
jgi:hypothetical protein